MYRILKRRYVLLMGVVWLLSFIALIITLNTTFYLEDTTSQIDLWLGFSLLFAVPAIAHSFACLMWFMKLPFYVCIGFIISAFACWGIKLLPHLEAAMGIMPLAQVYWPAMLVLAVVFPLIIWAMAIVLILTGRAGLLGL